MFWIIAKPPSPPSTQIPSLFDNSPNQHQQTSAILREKESKYMYNKHKQAKKSCEIRITEDRIYSTSTNELNKWNWLTLDSLALSPLHYVTLHFCSVCPLYTVYCTVHCLNMLYRLAWWWRLCYYELRASGTQSEYTVCIVFEWLSLYG